MKNEAHTKYMDDTSTILNYMDDISHKYWLNSDNSHQLGYYS